MRIHTFENRSLKEVGYRVENGCVKLGNHRKEVLNKHVEEVMLVRIGLSMSQIDMGNSAESKFSIQILRFIFALVISIIIFDDCFAMLCVRSLLHYLCLSGHVIHISIDR